ncbi:hypothetical protein 1 [Beihai picorna-like virus 8]|uniref:hypothetical protein 1 n=1 Tax=Beihai picorna-like virus 8 TaxID=1922627 RepID=UPI00090B4F6E|nr:hypothetical protein 1 [Beihai picorna-like virus 8]APG76851.1 hypothetical protein 1 [Beihai picorna-like virus 8]
MQINIISGNKDESEQTSHVCEIAYSRIMEAKQRLLVDVETVMSPQSFGSFASFVGIYPLLQQQLTSVALSKIEGLIALYLALSEVSSSKGFLAVLTLYAKTHSQESLISQLSQITDGLFDGVTPQSSERPMWLSQMLSGLTDWKLLVNSPAFSKISRVLSLMVTMGIIESKKVTLGNFELFAVAAMERQVTAIDLLDALVETTTFFAEGAYQCFVQGSIKPILFSSSKVVQMEEAYILKNTEFEYVRNGNLEKFMGKTEAQFDKELTTLIDELADLYKTMPSGTEKKIVQVKWEALSKMQAEFTALRVRGGLREAPFCVKIFADSGKGKSTFADLTMATVLKANNRPSTSDYIVTLNEKEKYMSTYRSYITGIKIDDYGNTKANFWEGAPSDWIIKICNNIREAAVMADIANKGKISIEPACLTITTNVEHLHAGITSNCPMSVLRRAHVHVELNVKKEFETDKMLDSQKVIDEFGTLDKVNDIWNITLKKPIGDGNSFSSWEILAKDISINEYLQYLVVESRKHFASQRIIVDSFKEPSNIIQMCDGCGNLDSHCSCEVEPHFGERIASVIHQKVQSVKVRTHYHSNVLQTKAEDFTVKHLLRLINGFEQSPYAQWTNWVPTQFIDNDYVKSAILYAGQDYIAEDVTSYVKKFAFVTFFLVMLVSRLTYSGAFLTLLLAAIYFLLCYASLVEAKKEAYFQAIVKQNGSLHEAFMSARNKHVHYACGLLASLGVLYGAAQVVKALRKSIGTQGSLAPRSVAEIQQRDKESNPWADQVAPTPVTSANSFSNHDETFNAMRSLVGQMVVGNQFSGCFMLKTNVVLIPHHFLPKSTTKAEIMYCSRKIKFLLNPTLVSQVGVGDLVAVYVPNTGPLKDATVFFTDNYAVHPLVCKMYGMDAKGEYFSDFLTWNQVSELNNGHLSFPGSHYRLGSRKTFAGMCMSPITRDAKRSCIIGFHIGGVTGTDRGCGISVLSMELKKAVDALHKKNDSFLCGPQARDVDDDVMGRKIVVNPGVHPKCPTNFINKEEAAVTVYGSVIGRSTYSSEVVETPISPIVEEVTGVKNQWGPPQFKTPDGGTWRPWFASLDVCSQPSIGFDPADVENAMRDYTAELFDEFDRLEEYWKNDMKPLNRIEVVSGIDGKRFIDSMKMSTSMGYPIMKKKSGFVIDLEPTEAHACPRTFVPEIWEEVDAILELADQGKSLNQIFNASLKDEPTKVTKDKVRVFQAAPIALQVLIRMYFLPVARFLSANPLVAECAVGINSHGPEWHELSEFMAQFGDDRIIAGDYSKYDLRMPEQLTLAAFGVMIQLAARSGNYTECDLKRMEVIAFEVCTPLVAYNGTLIRLMGTNPSGQNMTVYLNSIVNSLLHRLAFNSVYPKEELVVIGQELGLGRPARMRDLVALATYGDDARGSVREGYDRFNHISMAKFLEANDMKFTMPDKESAPVAFMNRFDADFLKRKDCFNPDLGVFVGQLDESSIFKSLHSILASKTVSPLEVSKSNLEGALREWFYYGRTHFEMRREQVLKIARKAGITSDEFAKDYDARVEAWKEKYEPQSGTLEECPDMVDLENPAHPIYQGVKYPKLVRKQVPNWVAMPDDELRHQYIMRMPHSTRVARNIRTALEIIMKYRQMVPMDVWEASVCSMSTIETPVSVRYEQELFDDVKSVLGKPLAEEYTVICPQFGVGDLLYMEDNTILVIECKRVQGRHESHWNKVKAQALRYGKVMSALFPNYTVYSMIFTERGFGIVNVEGEIRFPARFADVLDIATVEWA